MLNSEDKKRLLGSIDREGFDYCFVNLSEWKQIEDEEFHKLRKAYVDAADALEKYIGSEATPAGGAAGRDGKA